MDERMRKVMLMADLCVGNAEWRVRVTAISETEVMIESAVFPALGAMLRIKLPNLHWVGATAGAVSERSMSLQLHSRICPAAVRQRITGSFAPRTRIFEDQLRCVA